MNLSLPEALEHRQNGLDAVGGRPDLTLLTPNPPSMKADTFAKLVVLESLIEAEIGYFLEHTPTSLDRFREGMVSRISDLIDEIDVLDSVAAGRVYDAVVDFLAELPEDDEEGVVEATIRFRRGVARIVERGMDRRDLGAAATWAVVLDEALAELGDEYHLAIAPGDAVRPREYIRAEALLNRARQAADRMMWSGEIDRPEIPDELDRLLFSIRHRHLPPTEVDFTIRSLRRQAAKYRPSTLTRIGVFVLKQVLGRDRPRALAGKGSRRTIRSRTKGRGG